MERIESGLEVLSLGPIEAVCFDLGDTLIAEETVIHDSSGIAVSADVIPGALEVLKSIKGRGYKIALIANADSLGARNILKATGLHRYFDVTIISEELGYEKPDLRIFTAALDKLKTPARSAVMVGNRRDADIIGANKSGMKSIWFKWNNRYSDAGNGDSDKPHFQIDSLLKILEVLPVISHSEHG